MVYYIASRIVQVHLYSSLRRICLSANKCKLTKVLQVLGTVPRPPTGAPPLDHLSCLPSPDSWSGPLPYLWSLAHANARHREMLWVMRSCLFSCARCVQSIDDCFLGLCLQPYRYMPWPLWEVVLIDLVSSISSYYKFPLSQFKPSKSVILFVWFYIAVSSNTANSMQITQFVYDTITAYPKCQSDCGNNLWIALTIFAKWRCSRAH